MTDEVNAPIAETPTPEADAPKVETPAPKERDRVQERIDELTREKNDLRRRLESLEKPKEPEVKELKRPTLEESNYDEDAHNRAMDAYYESLIEKKAAERVEKVLTEREQREKAQKVNEAFESKLSKLTDEERERVMRAPADAVMADVIKASEVGPELCLYLEEHRDEAAQIMRLPDVQKARELGRIEARLELKASSKTDAPKSPPVSKAPPPVPKIEAAEGSVSVKADSPESDNLSIEDWVKKREKQLRAKR